MSLNWDAVSGAVSYNVYWSTDETVESSGDVIDNPGGNLASVTNNGTHSSITPGLGYFYCVTAVFGDGDESAESEMAFGQLNAPLAITETATGVTSTTATLNASINPNDVSTNCYFEYGTDTSYGATTPGNALIGSEVVPLSASLTGLTLNTTYHFRVVAINNDNISNSSQGEDQTFTTLAGDPPQAPTGVSASPGDTQVTLTWSAVDGATGYNIYWAESEGVTIELGTQIAGATSPYVHTGLTNETTYYYVVTAENANGESIESNEVLAIPSATCVPPPAPSGVAASPQDGQAQISWSPVDGAISYNIYWAQTTGVTQETGTQIAGVTSPYIHTSLTNGTTYYYIVTAVGCDESADSSENDATPSDTGAPPGAPSVVSADPGDSQATIFWDPVGGATSYNIYWSTTTGVTTGTGTLIEGVISPYIHTSLTNGTTYYYIVTALNFYGEGTASSEFSATPDAVPPEAPTNLTVFSGDGQITVGWSAVAAATAYNIYWSTTPGVTTATGTQIADVTNPYTHTGLTNGTTYYAVVTAVNASGESVESAEVSAIPVAIPANVSAAAGDAAVEISWDAAAGANSYSIYWSTSTGVTKGTGIEISGVTSPYAHTGLSNATTYYYVVTAANATGESAVSTEVSATPQVSAEPPGAPTITAEPGNAQVTISWNSVLNASSYNVYIGLSAGVTQSSFSSMVDGVVALSYTWTSLTNDTPYYFVVTAVNANGQSGDSNVASATPEAPPAAPSGLSATAGDQQITVDWNPVVGATGYKVYWATFTPVTKASYEGTVSDISTDSYIHSDLINGTTYYYAVTALKVGESAISSEVNAIPVGAPIVTTGSAELVTSTSATLNGAVNPNALSTTYAFEYGTDTNYGTTTTAVDAGDGIANVEATTAISSLTPNTVYHYRLNATNSAGTTNGDDATFQTIALPASVPGTVSDASDESATLVGTVDPNGDATSYYFEYGLDTNYGSTTTSADAGSGWDAGGVSAIISGLAPDTEYHFRLVAANSVGSTNSADATFRTIALPGAAPASATLVTSTAARLNGSVDPNGDSTSYYFEYGPDTNYGTSTTAADAGSGWSSGAVFTDISGLSPDTEYHFRLVATNSVGTTNSADLTFRTIAAPGAAASAASLVTSTTARLNGTVDPNGDSTSYYFEYGLDTNYGSDTLPAADAGSGWDPGAVSADISSLTPDTEYHFRVVATNGVATTNSEDLTFRTIDEPAVVTGTPVTEYTSSTATLPGTVDPNGDETTYFFELGTVSGTYTFTSVSASAGSGWDAVAVTTGVSGLNANTPYYYRIAAYNSVNGSGSPVYGSEQSFTTPNEPGATTDPAISVGSTTATINGRVNPNGVSTTYYFEYGTDTNYGTQVPDPAGNAGSGTSDVSFSETLTGLLTPNTEYHYRIVATNTNGTGNGADVTFRTIAAPSAAIGAATSITGYAATLTGDVDPNGDTTHYRFEYGTTSGSYTNYTAYIDIGSGWSPTAVSNGISGLTAGTTYYYRIAAYNSVNGVGSPVYSGENSFSTASALIWNTHNWNEAPWGP